MVVRLKTALLEIEDLQASNAVFIVTGKFYVGYAIERSYLLYHPRKGFFPQFCYNLREQKPYNIVIRT